MLRHWLLTISFSMILATCLHSEEADYIPQKVEPGSRGDSMFTALEERVEPYFHRRFYVFPNQRDRKGLVNLTLNGEMNSLETLDEVMFCFIAHKPLPFPDFINKKNLKFRAPITRDVIGGKQSWLIDPAKLPEFEVYYEDFHKKYPTKISRQSHASEYYEQLSSIAPIYKDRFNRLLRSVFESTIDSIAVNEEDYLFEDQILRISFRTSFIIERHPSPLGDSFQYYDVENDIDYVDLNVSPEEAEMIISESQKGNVSVKALFHFYNKFSHGGFADDPQFASRRLYGLQLSISGESFQRQDRWVLFSITPSR